MNCSVNYTSLKLHNFSGLNGRNGVLSKAFIVQTNLEIYGHWNFHSTERYQFYSEPEWKKPKPEQNTF